MEPLYIQRIGTGDARHFLGLHGWGGGWRTFEPLVPYMPEDVTIWSVDLPGYGRSAPLSDWSASKLIDRLARGIEDLPVLELLGNCSGADFGLALAKRCPDRFTRLVLIDPFAYFPWYFKLLVSRGPGRFFYASAFENPLGRWVTNRGLADNRSEDTHLTASFAELDHGVVYEYLRMLYQLGDYRGMADLDHPTTIAYGEKTFDAVRRSVQMWREIWPHAKTHELPGAGHLPIQEATQSLAEVVFESK